MAFAAVALDLAARQKTLVHANAVETSAFCALGLAPVPTGLKGLATRASRGFTWQSVALDGADTA
jgi:hypothetical protein